MTLGQNIKYWRLQLAMSLDDLGRRAGVSRTTIHNLERDRSKPKPETLGKIASALHVKVEDLSEEFAQKVSEKASKVPKKVATRTSPFGKNLTRLRQEKNLSQVQLAKLLGVSRQCVHIYETEVKFPTPQTLKKIASALHVKIEQLLED